MPDLIEKIKTTNWQSVTEGMHDKGYSILPGLLNPAQCQALIERFDNPDEYRKTVVMERYRYGLGSYKYWDYPLPELVQTLRENLYPNLAPIANSWMKLLRIDKRFPESHHALLETCHQSGQQKPTPLILQYGKGGYNTLHQDLYGEVFFPIQAACLLSEPGKDFTGGEFVLTEQVPRAQSKAMVLTPNRGDMIIFTTNFRAAKGKHGYYRANMRHGISEVHSGMRYTMGIIFHDAAS